PNEPVVQSIPDSSIRVQDSALMASNLNDSLAKAKMAKDTHFTSSKDSVMYKFVILQTYNKLHALKRYNQLLSYDLKINMYNKDSNFFKLYFAFPAKARDTVRIKDSLERQYAHSVSIEQ
ncbi:MAG TPA: hypothetical protein VFV08_06895, partial [Puia sp.]|nr:hypothetical protein [Puia sp.]